MKFRSKKVFFFRQTIEWNQNGGPGIFYRSRSIENDVFWRTSLQDGVYGLGVNLFTFGRRKSTVTRCGSER
jgi:hypothetical protein